MASGTCFESHGNNRTSVSIRGTAIRLRGKRKTRELLTRKTVLSHPMPNSLTETGASAGKDISTSDFANSGVTTQSGFHTGAARRCSSLDMKAPALAVFCHDPNPSKCHTIRLCGLFRFRTRVAEQRLSNSAAESERVVPASQAGKRSFANAQM